MNEHLIVSSGHFLPTLAWLLIGHALCDYPLQGDFIGKFKSPRVPSPVKETIWPYLLTAHSLIHAGAVWLITGSPFAGIEEFVTHWQIDLGKSLGYFGFHTDQVLHVACKVLWALALWYAIHER